MPGIASMNPASFKPEQRSERAHSFPQFCVVTWFGATDRWRTATIRPASEGDGMAATTAQTKIQHNDGGSLSELPQLSVLVVDDDQDV